MKAALVWLYIEAITAGNGSIRDRTPFKDFASCERALSTARIDVAKGGDSEGVVVMWCAGSHVQFKGGTGDYVVRDVHK